MQISKLAISLAAVWACAPFLTLAADKFSDVVELAPDTYSISRIDHGGIFGNAGKMKTAVFKEAQAFAESKGKVAVARHIHEEPLAIGRFASIEYVFWVLDKTDAAAHREDLYKEPDHVSTEHVQIDVKQQESQSQQLKKDLYQELMKLDDLRKRGLLTDAEFEQQKQKLLSQ